MYGETFYGRHTAQHNSKKGLPFETKSTQNHKNQRLGVIESLYMQYCCLWGCYAHPPPPPPTPTLPLCSASLSGIQF